MGNLIYFAYTRPDISFAINMVDVFTDADWADSITDKRSTSGYCTSVAENLVTWRSKKQGVIARCSVDVEFKVAALRICKLYCDNKSAIVIAHNPILHDRTKHVEINKHFIKEKIDSGQIYMP
ncbi:hypothetical protein QYF36_008125 [Acer negundo]|nr:hypothetical protein QYF36_008125 [Acer negundo]